MTSLPDHLQEWLTVRRTMPWHTRGAVDVPTDPPIVPRRDGAVTDIRTYDHARDPQRAAGLLAALDQVRADAAARRQHTFTLISAWQCRVLDVSEAPFRTQPAFAKAGRERYGIGPDTRDRFEDCLAESDDPAIPLAARAARTYLDVCYFHPFSDGNARSAFLALTFVLGREGIVLDQVGPIRRLDRHADDPEGAPALVDLVATLISTTCRRGSSPRRSCR
jgi:hypothetical protein